MAEMSDFLLEPCEPQVEAPGSERPSPANAGGDRMKQFYQDALLNTTALRSDVTQREIVAALLGEAYRLDELNVLLKAAWHLNLLAVVKASASIHAPHLLKKVLYWEMMQEASVTRPEDHVALLLSPPSVVSRALPTPQAPRPPEGELPLPKPDAQRPWPCGTVPTPPASTRLAPANGVGGNGQARCGRRGQSCGLSSGY